MADKTTLSAVASADLANEDQKQVLSAEQPVHLDESASDHASSASTGDTDESIWEDESSADDQDDQADQDEEEYFESELVPGGRLESETLKELESRYPSQLGVKRSAGKKHQVESAHTSYVVSQGVLETLMGLTTGSFRHTDKDKLVRLLLAANHNVRPVAQAGTKDSAFQAGKDEREVDREIRTALTSGKPLSEYACLRASQQLNLLCELSESIPRDVFSVIISAYAKLRDEHGQPAVPKATRTAVSKFRTAAPHRATKPTQPQPEQSHISTKPHISTAHPHPGTRVSSRTHLPAHPRTAASTLTLQGKPIARPLRSHHAAPVAL